MADKLASNPPKIDADDLDWAARSNYWLSASLPKARKSRNTPREPIILAGHGIKLSVNRGTLLVRNGFTHYPQEREEFRLFSGNWRLPSQIVILDGDGAVSIDAISWLGERNIPLVKIDWRGNVISVVGGSGFPLDRKKIDGQLKAQKTGAGFRLAVRAIAEKVANSAETLRKGLPHSLAVEQAIEKLGAVRTQLVGKPPKALDQLLGLEGRAGRAYFNAWKGAPINWAQTSKWPIPEEWKFIGPRLSYASTKSHKNRNATHPVNAMLNYAYGMLEYRVRQQVLAAGLDPTIGYLHGSYRDKPTLVLDLMEPLRPVVDCSVLKLVREHMFTRGDFTLNSEGVCRLNPQLARAVAYVVANVGMDVPSMW